MNKYLFLSIVIIQVSISSLTSQVTDDNYVLIETPGEDFNIATGNNFQNLVAPLRITQTGNFPSSDGRSILIDANQIEQAKETAGLYINDTSSSTLILNRGGGNVSIGDNIFPKSKLHITDGDVYIDDVTKGVIMKSPNGSCWRITPDDNGVLLSTAITCPN